MKVNTIAYKGSKKKLLENIKQYTIGETFLDAFCGSGVVSAYMRNCGKIVCANDKNYSSYLFTKVFLEGFEQKEIDFYLDEINQLKGINGWITQNYSGEKFRKSKRSDSEDGIFPMAFTTENAQKIDHARDYVENLNINKKNKNALVFSIILAADNVLNNTCDQKSSFKKWLPRAKNNIKFISPKNITGPEGTAYNSDILEIKQEKFDTVYLDPPYSNGVLYASCYHINDSIALWDKPTLNYSYALPRPERACFNNKKSGMFYSKKNIKNDFKKILNKFKNSKRIIISYSDCPKNLISIQEIINISENYGKVTVNNIKHKICSQSLSQKKSINNLNEYFIIINMNI